MRALALALPVALAVAVGATAGSPEMSARPAERPERAAAPEVAAMRNAHHGGAVTGMSRSPRPELRPANVLRRLTGRDGSAASGGGLCGFDGLAGARVPPVRGRLRGCGIAQPVKLSRVGGLALSRPALVDCPTAAALLTWVENGLKPAVGEIGGGPAGLKVAASYSCRTRNSRKGAKLSEHAKGRAIDISGVTLRNGATLTVSQGWRDPGQGPVMRAMHGAACGPFGTVLGPAADRYHQDHFHFDTARYRNGAYCR